MTTRNRLQRGEESKEFAGRVRLWSKEWKPAGNSIKLKKLLFQKWAPTGGRHDSAPGKRFPELTPVPTPGGKPILPLFMRPAPKMKVKLKLNAGAKKLVQGQGAPVPSAVPGIAPAAVPSQAPPPVAAPQQPGPF